MAEHELDALIVSGSEYSGFEGSVTYMSGFPAEYVPSGTIAPFDVTVSPCPTIIVATVGNAAPDGHML